MRLLLLSDIHGNAPALEAVLRDAGKRSWDSTLFLGDLVGYYTEPERVANLLQELAPGHALLGNHDQQLLDMGEGKRSQSGEDDLIAGVLERHLQELSADSIDFLRGFAAEACGDGWQAVHGALRERWEYIDGLSSAQANLRLLERKICFVGHTHVPKVFAQAEADGESLWRTVSFHKTRSVYRIPPKAKVIFNPGSVGQPRDGSPLASYAIFDDQLQTIELFRVEFDVRAVQRSVRDRGYPPILAERLAEGR